MAAAFESAPLRRRLLDGEDEGEDKVEVGEEAGPPAPPPSQAPGAPFAGAPHQGPLTPRSANNSPRQADAAAPPPGMEPPGALPSLLYTTITSTSSVDKDVYDDFEEIGL
eukprot:1181333-Prorocentrum_minimum.AAC.3